MPPRTALRLALQDQAQAEIPYTPPAGVQKRAIWMWNKAGICCAGMVAFMCHIWMYWVRLSGTCSLFPAGLTWRESWLDLIGAIRWRRRSWILIRDGQVKKTKEIIDTAAVGIIKNPCPMFKAWIGGFCHVLSLAFLRLHHLFVHRV